MIVYNLPPCNGIIESDSITLVKTSVSSDSIDVGEQLKAAIKNDEKDPIINSGESTTLSYSGGNGKTFKWYSGSCGGTPIGEGNNFKVAPKHKTTYYGRWEDSDKVSDCIVITVNVIEKKEICNRSKTYSFGKYSGDMKYSDDLKLCYPDGQGTMVYTKRIRIARHDNKEHYSGAGYSLVGTWINGDISNGILKDNNGTEVEYILAGARNTVYDLENDNR